MPIPDPSLSPPALRPEPSGQHRSRRDMLPPTAYGTSLAAAYWAPACSSSSPSSSPTGARRFPLLAAAAIAASFVAAASVMMSATRRTRGELLRHRAICCGHSVGELPMPSTSPSSLPGCHTHSRFFPTWLNPRGKWGYSKRIED